MRVHISAPCPEDWVAMPGDERSRHCARCAYSVTNLSALRLPEAEAVMASREGRLCVRFERDAAGEVVTRTNHETRFLSALRALAAHKGQEPTP